MSRYDHVVKGLKSQTDAIVYPPARKEAIAKWSFRNGMPLSSSLQEWVLTTNGSLSAVGFLHGVSGKQSFQQFERVRSLPGALVIGHTGLSCFVLLDGVVGRHGVVECHVNDLRSGRWLETAVVLASSLDRFLMIASMLENKLGPRWPTDRAVLLELDPDLLLVQGFVMPWDRELAGGRDLNVAAPVNTGHQSNDAPRERRRRSAPREAQVRQPGRVLTADIVAELIGRFRDQEESTLHPSPSPTAIDDWETKNGITLPSDYRTWLSQCNGAEITGAVLFGVGKSAKSGRIQLVGSMPHAIQIGSDGCGNPFILLDAVNDRHGVVFCESPDHLSSRWERTAVAMASSFERYLTIASMLRREADDLWPTDEDSMLRLDPNLSLVRGFRMPWEID